MHSWPNGIGSIKRTTSSNLLAAVDIDFTRGDATTEFVLIALFRLFFILLRTKIVKRR
jgi:hypothetical protein